MSRESKSTSDCLPNFDFVNFSSGSNQAASEKRDFPMNLRLLKFNCFAEESENFGVGASVHAVTKCFCTMSIRRSFVICKCKINVTQYMNTPAETRRNKILLLFLHPEVI